MASENKAMKIPLYGESGTGRNNGRKNGKGPKKPPQRGVGVEQLEKMRLQQESMQKMAASGSVLHIDHQQQQFLLNYGPLSSTGSFQFPQQQQHVLVGSGFVPYGGNKSGFSVGGVGNCSNVGAGWFVPNHQQNNNRVNVGNYGSGSLLCSPFGRNPFEPSKELSSMPNLHSQSFDLCLKENHVMRGGTNGRREMPMDVWSNHHVHDFLGYVPQPAQPFVSAYATHHNLDESVEVVAVHKRASSSSGRDKIFMEYEFFPEKDERGTSTKNMKLLTSSTIGFGEASSSLSLNVSAFGGDSANDLSSIDLSLKL